MALIQFDPSQHEGILVRQRNQVDVFLVLDGKRRHVPDPQTFRNLFGESDVDEVLDINTIDDDDALSSGAVLARANNNPAQFLVSNGKKRHITSQEAKDKYHLVGSVVVAAPVLVEFIPQGDPINA